MKVFYGPPGTGKTRTLVGIAEKHDALGHKVLFLSFTKSAAQEATRRLRQKDCASTLHSLAFRTCKLSPDQVLDGRRLIEFGNVIGIPITGNSLDDERSVGDEYHQVLTFARSVGTEEETAYNQSGAPGTPAQFAYFVESYNSYKKEFGFVDYTDMLTMFSANLEAAPRKMCDVLIVDEAQDLSPLQWEIFYALAAKSDFVYLAGDDDQAIYTWAGADPYHLVTLSKKEDHQILDQSYRIPYIVHDYAVKIARAIPFRVDKEFKPRDAGGSMWRTADTAHIPWGNVKSNTMVLFRDRYKVRALERELRRSLIPYALVGQVSPFTNKYARAIAASEEKDSLDLVKGIGAPIMWWDFYIMLADNREVLKEPPHITIGTMHRVKGMEADHVVVDATLDGRSLKSAELDPDSERRLLYVACTRARETLTICGDNGLLPEFN